MSQSLGAGIAAWQSPGGAPQAHLLWLEYWSPPQLLPPVRHPRVVAPAARSPRSQRASLGRRPSLYCVRRNERCVCLPLPRFCRRRPHTRQRPERKLSHCNSPQPLVVILDGASMLMLAGADVLVMRGGVR